MALNRSESTTTTETDLSKVEGGPKYADKNAPAGRMPLILEDDELQNMDDAAKALKGQDLNFTEAEERKVLRKIDWRLMPIMAWTCGLQFVDKAAISNAAVFGMKDDLNLVGSEYSWGVSIFYFGYLLGTYPSLWAMQKFHIGRFIAIMTFCWGVTIIAMLGVTNFGGLMAARFLLGLFESCLSPGFLAITTRWYRQEEQPFRFALWTLTNGLMPIPALVIYYGIGHADGGALAPWRYIFLLLGLLTVITGVLCFWLLPNTPADVTWLDERGRAIAVERVARSQTGISNTKWKWSQFREAMLDVRAWLTVMTLFLSQSGGAITTNFIGIIINGFGYPQLKSMLLQAPAFAIQAAVCLLVTGLVTFTKFFRYAKQPLLSVAACAVVAGTAVIYTHQPTAANRQLLLGMMYMIALNNCSFTTIMSVVGTNFAGATKKTTVNTMTFVAYCISNIVIPQAFLGRESPTYHTGILTVMCFQIALVICYWTNWTLMTLENKRRDKVASDQAPQSEDDIRQARIISGLKDMTDRENLAFRYAP